MESNAGQQFRGVKGEGRGREGWGGGVEGGREGGGVGCGSEGGREGVTWDNGRTIKTDLLSSSELSTLPEHT